MKTTKNIGLIAHANHGKTSLMNSILEALGEKGHNKHKKKKEQTIEQGYITFDWSTKH